MNKVTNLADYKKTKAADAFSEEMVNAVEIPNYKTDCLRLITSYAERIVYFSGDVEEGEKRAVKTVNAEQLLNASSTLLFNIELLSKSILRLNFDGEYFYDLYFETHLTSELITLCIETLKAEIEVNQIQNRINQEKFNNTVNNLLKD
jgi:hypothetical protein